MAPRLLLPVRRARPGLVVDVALAGVLAAWSVTEVATGSVHGPHVVALVAGLAMSVPLVWRRRTPVVVAAVVTAAFLVEARIGVDTRSQVSTMAELPAAAYALGAYAPLVAGLAVVVGQVAVGATVGGAPSLASVLFALLVIGAGFGVGFAIRSHRGRSARLAAAVVEEQHRSQTAALEERARIARELHDIVAHSVGIMVIQAGGASEVLRSDPRAVEEALQSIQDTGRQALDELRRLLGVLRAHEEPAALAPQPGLRQLPELVGQVGAAGLPVRLSIDPGMPDLPASLELSVYRIVQEALTNTVKHAGATGVEVEVGFRAGTVEVVVVDDGRGADGVGGAPGGHGLGGMRERVAMYGGTLSAGPADGSGFRVRARLPLTTLGEVAV
jgi:signal transduction histidine kinase